MQHDPNVTVPKIESVTDRIPQFALAHLSQRDHDLVLRLLARTSEAAYRRGLEHGAAFGAGQDYGKTRAAIMRRFRGVSLGVSPTAWPDHETGRQSTVKAIWRLFVSTGWKLEQIGLKCPDNVDGPIQPKPGKRAFVVVPQRPAYGARKFRSTAATQRLRQIGAAVT
jgi:hypothetical protein